MLTAQVKMTRYQFVSNTYHQGQRIDLPNHARGVTVVPTDKPNILRVTYLRPLRRFTPSERDGSERIDLGKY